MARPRKNAPKPNTQELALVPVEDQPYPLPEGWKWVRLLSAFTNHTDSKKKLQQKEYLPSGSFAVVDQGKELVGGYTERRELLYSGPLPAIIFGDHTRCVKFIDFPFVQGADGVKVLHAKDTITHKFFYYALINVDIPHLGYRRHFPLFDQFILPLPPLDEQERIVTRIESLFAKLDEAKEKAEAVLDSYETRKAAILHKAFTGELTAKWREERGIERDSWKRQTLNAVCSSIFDGDHMPPPKAETGIPFLVISNVNTGSISFENTRFVPQTYFDSLSSTRKPKQNDVLYTLVGSYGIPVLVDTNKNFCFQRHMALLKPHSIDSKFLWYFLQTKEAFLYASQVATGTAQLTVPIKKLREMPILHPSLNEQQEISRILDSLLEKEQQSKEAAETVLEQIDLMKKAILAKAFRGELDK